MKELFMRLQDELGRPPTKDEMDSAWSDMVDNSYEASRWT